MEKSRMKGLVLDEAKWAVEILLVLIIFYFLLTLSGLTITDIFDKIGSSLYDIFSQIFNGISSIITSWIQSWIPSF